MPGVDESLESLDAIKKIILDVAVIVKEGVGFGNLPRLFRILGELKVLGENAKLVMPELKDLDPQEVGKLSEAAYAGFKEVYDALK